jgi:hypothetical protein
MPPRRDGVRSKSAKPQSTDRGDCRRGSSPVPGVSQRRPWIGPRDDKPSQSSPHDPRVIPLPRPPQLRHGLRLSNHTASSTPNDELLLRESSPTPTPLYMFSDSQWRCPRRTPNSKNLRFADVDNDNVAAFRSKILRRDLNGGETREPARRCPPRCPQRQQRSDSAPPDDDSDPTKHKEADYRNCGGRIARLGGYARRRKKSRKIEKHREKLKIRLFGEELHEGMFVVERERSRPAQVLPRAFHHSQPPSDKKYIKTTRKDENRDFSTGKWAKQRQKHSENRFPAILTFSNTNLQEGGARCFGQCGDVSQHFVGAGRQQCHLITDRFCQLRKLDLISARWLPSN